MKKKDILMKEARISFWEKNGKLPKYLDEDELTIGDNNRVDKHGRFRILGDGTAAMA
ncbi:MAG: hypothetical protein ACQESG_06310 [Nanobdellota archaeon]